MKSAHIEMKPCIRIACRCGEAVAVKTRPRLHVVVGVVDHHAAMRGERNRIDPQGQPGHAASFVVFAAGRVFFASARESVRGETRTLRAACFIVLPDFSAALARASLDAVLHRWSGLGYYARARNLHRCAAEILARHDGVFPQDFEAVRRLPGIGRSTAGAILALAFDRRHAILDGNVKRVLARYHVIAEPLGRRATEEQLWRLAERHTPRERLADYTQAIMDLGATVCTRAHPDCPRCPLARGCQARRAGDPRDYPVRAARRPLPVRKTRMLLIRDGAERVLLQQRPPAGL